MDNKSQIKFSIICATFNRAHIISRCIESVLSQTVNEWEMIIIDDGSTDNTSEIVSEYLIDTRIQYYKMDENRGVGVARNYGISKSNTSWILLLDSDNAFLSDALEKMRNKINAFPDVFIHKFCVKSFDGYPMGESPIDSILIHANNYICGRFKGEYQPLVQSDLLVSYPFFEDFNGGEAVTWSLIALDCGLLAYHPDIVQLYENEMDDRLSVRTRNYSRLKYVFIADISNLWKVYLLNCPSQLVIRVLKLIVYMFPSVFRKPIEKCEKLIS